MSRDPRRPEMARVAHRDNAYMAWRVGKTVEHRTSKDDLVPPWYKRGAYVVILLVIVFIVVYGIYLMVAPHTPPPPVDNASNPYSEGIP